ncbi:MAG: ATP-binding protein, partial [Jatrophihabitantaceae bacterium]
MAADKNNPSYYTLPLPNGADAPALARRYLAEHASWLEPDVLDDALLIVSELVTNAIRHGQPDIFLSLRNDPPRVGVAIQDAGRHMPRLTDFAPGNTEPTGRGLLVVDALADDWGVVPRESPPGKTI